MTTNEPTSVQQYLTFSVAEEEYGVSVLAVREILEYGVVTRVPRAPSHIRGVMNLRGRVVPLVDLAVRLGIAARPLTPRTCVVVVEMEIEGERVVIGLVVDAVSQVVELSPKDIEPPPAFGSIVDVALLVGMGRSGKRFVLLLDVDRILSGAQAIGLSSLVEDGPRPSASRAQTLVSSAVAALLALLVLAVPTVSAQEPIKDNSFLIEEAYNQERGVVQHISAFSRSASEGTWLYTFTQEWPMSSQRHQVSFTLPVQSLQNAIARDTGVGDLALNYRYQVPGLDGGPLAFSPRLSLLAPTGRSSRSLGAGGFGLQANLPLSVEIGSRVVTHWNAGMTRSFSARSAEGHHANTNSYALGQSLVWLAGSKVNLLVETVWARAQSVAGKGLTASDDSMFVSPGIRWAHDFKNGLQIVPGIAFPIGVGPSRGEHGVFLYLSFEHPFRHSR